MGTVGVMGVRRRSGPRDRVTDGTSLDRRDGPADGDDLQLPPPRCPVLPTAGTTANAATATATAATAAAAVTTECYCYAAAAAAGAAFTIDATATSTATALLLPLSLSLSQPFLLLLKSLSSHSFVIILIIRKNIGSIITNIYVPTTSTYLLEV